MDIAVRQRLLEHLDQIMTLAETVRREAGHDDEIAEALRQKGDADAARYEEARDNALRELENLRAAADRIRRELAE